VKKLGNWKGYIRDGQCLDTCIGDTYRAILLYRASYRFNMFSCIFFISFHIYLLAVKLSTQSRLK